jgi:lysozyme
MKQTQSTKPTYVREFGIDVSHHNGKIDWLKVWSQQVVPVSFVFHKATEGGTFVSPALLQNWEACNQNPQIKNGLYHFLTTNVTTQIQAAHFCNTMKSVGFDPNKNFYVLDLEDNKGKLSPAELGERIDTFLEITTKVYSVKPIIYTRTTFCQENLKNIVPKTFSKSDLWISRYFDNKGNDVIKNHDEPVNKAVGLPLGFDDWAIWQYTDKGTLPGINGNVDLNVWKDPTPLLVGDTQEFSQDS